MAVGVHRVAVVVVEIVSVHVARKAVAVPSVGGHIQRVGPDVGGQVGIGVIDARIEYGNDHVAAARGNVPSVRRINVGMGLAAGLARVVQTPQLREHRIIGHRGSELVGAVEFVLGDIAVVGQETRHRRGGRSFASHQHFTDQP